MKQGGGGSKKVVEETAEQAKSMLSKKDYEEIRSMVREQSQKSALSVKKSESGVTGRGSRVEGESVAAAIMDDGKSM